MTKKFNVSISSSLRGSNRYSSIKEILNALVKAHVVLERNGVSLFQTINSSSVFIATGFEMVLVLVLGQKTF